MPELANQMCMLLVVPFLLRLIDQSAASLVCENLESVAGYSIESFDELLSRRRKLVKNEQISPTDAICLAPIPETQGKLWISTPNMWFVPEFPKHSETEMSGYFSDGMLGKHEYLKWPQPLYRPEAHSFCAPANPRFLGYFQEPEKYGTGPFTYSTLESPFKDLFSDLEVTWFDLERLQDFSRTTAAGSRHLGSLSSHLLPRLGNAMREVQRLIRDIGQKQLSSLEEESPHDAQRAAKPFLTQARLANQLEHAFHNMFYYPMEWFDALMWFREYQRLLLDLRAGVIWYTIVNPRLRNPKFFQPFPILPVRGVFTVDLTALHDLFRVGIPVWLVRDRGTLTDSMFVNRVKAVVPCSRFFSQSKEDTTTCTSSWTPDLRQGMFSERYIDLGFRKNSLLSHPVLSAATEYVPEDTPLPSPISVDVQRQSDQAFAVVPEDAIQSALQPGAVGMCRFLNCIALVVHCFHSGTPSPFFC
jgi:hypothetical protein